jgi:dTDP-4-amino-4,6-dideoxygalactose transaminase
MVVTDDVDLARRLRILRQHGSEPRYVHSVLGGNFRLDALQAAVLRVKLPALPGWTDGRRRNAAHYRAGFAARGLLEQVALPQDVPGHIYNQFVIRVQGDGMGSRNRQEIRDDLRAWLAARDIGTEIYYPLPLPHQPCFAHLGCRAGQFPIAEQAAREVLALPIFPELSVDQMDTVMDAVQAFFTQ